MKRFIIFIIGLALFGTYGCSNLDLAPEDFYGSGNFWSKTAQVEGYMLGLHSDLRASYEALWILGEARGGTQKTGVSSTGASIDASIPIKDNSLTKDNHGVSNWYGFYGKILQINLFIRNVETGCEFLSDSERGYMLGQAYGLRAFYYFLLYRAWGGVPLITEAEVVYNEASGAKDLYRPRATPKEILDFIKEDINTSDDYFGNDFSFKGTRSVWSKSATLMLKAEIYLWSAKVTTGDQSPAATDLQTAKDALTPLMGRFNLLPNFSDVFDYTKKDNDEIIFTLRFREGEGTNWGALFLYGAGFPAGIYYAENGSLINSDILDLRGVGGPQRHDYKFGLFESYDDTDSRKRATFLDFYADAIKSDGGLVMKKGVGFVNANGNRIFVSDIPVYRCADALLLMAEVENKMDNDPSAYINEVRRRAYGNNFNAALHEHVDAGFAANELAILHERDKEFVWEGKRWFDVVRMHDANGRALVFAAAANYDSSAPILNYETEAYRLLWPIAVNTLNDDPTLEQTPGYE